MPAASCCSEKDSFLCTSPSPCSVFHRKWSLFTSASVAYTLGAKAFEQTAFLSRSNFLLQAMFRCVAAAFLEHSAGLCLVDYDYDVRFYGLDVLG